MRFTNLLRVAFVGMVLSAPSSALVTVTSPSSASPRFPAGPDYATDVLADAWDMSNPEDISPDPDERAGWATFGFNNGTVGGKTNLVFGQFSDSSITFLGRGYIGVINPGRTGQRYPIDSTVYKKVAWKMYSGVAGQLPKVRWFQNPRGGPDQLGATFAAQETIVGYRIFMPDNVNAPFAQPTTYSKWDAAPIMGFQLGPNGTVSGHDVFYDWVRITRSDDDPLSVKMMVTWTSTTGGNGNLEITDTSGAVLNIATGQPSQYNFNYGVLPPGQYSLRVLVGNDVSAPVSFRINNPPLARITEPNETGSEDFATTVLGNAWDMNEATDVDTLSNVTNVSFAGGVLNATDTNGDAGVAVFNRDTAVTIDTNRYRYLTYRMKLDGPYSLGGGSVARVFWSAFYNPTATQVTTSRDILVWPGLDPNTPDFFTYTIDLSTLTIGNGGLEAAGAQRLWTADRLKMLRLDPHEFSTPRSFHYDFIKLAAMAEARGTFTLKYSSADADPEDLGAARVKLYYATSQTLASRVLIASGLPSSTAGQYAWDVSTVTPGAYWIYAEVGDGIDTRGQFSTGQVRVLAPIGRTAIIDVDANGQSDALTDGLMILRYLFGLTGNPLTNGAIGAGASRTSSTEIKNYLDGIKAQLDVDGNAQVDALTDGLMIIRYLFNLRGNSLTSGAIGGGATRNQTQIESFLQTLVQ